MLSFIVIVIVAIIIMTIIITVIILLFLFLFLLLLLPAGGVPPLLQKRRHAAVVQVNADPCDSLLSLGIPRQCLHVQEEGTSAAARLHCRGCCQQVGPQPCSGIQQSPSQLVSMPRSAYRCKPLATASTGQLDTLSLANSACDTQAHLLSLRRI